jgi:integrase
MAKQLTAAAVERLKPARERREIRDGGAPGLHLVIQTSGVKSWALRFRRPGTKRSAKLTLGRVDVTNRAPLPEPVVGQLLTLAEARRLAGELNHSLALGRDPAAAKRREKLEREARSRSTFATAAADFVEQHARRRTRGWKETARLLGLRPADEGEGFELISKGLVDSWRDKPIADIDGDEIHLLIDEVRGRGVPGLERRNQEPSEPRARALFRAMSKMFSWLVAKRRLANTPCAGVERPDTPRSRDRVLNEAEVANFWKAASAERREFAALLKTLLLTAQRLGEVSGMTCAELSDGIETWTIPGARTKNHLTQTVPLSKMARELIEGVIRKKGNLVFTTTGETPISGWSKIKTRLDAAMEVPDWRLHDLRRTAATMMADPLGVPPHIIEAVLNHISGHKAGVAGVYNRARYATEMRQALDAWARYVALIVDDDLYAAHRAHLRRGGDRAREAFVAAIREGCERWSLYLRAIAGPPENVVAMPVRA